MATLSTFSNMLNQKAASKKLMKEQAVPAPKPAKVMAPKGTGKRSAFMEMMKSGK